MSTQLPPAKAAPLSDWIQWLEALDPSKIDMGLERTKKVLSQMGLSKPAVPVVTVAGTNGKGSTVAYLQSIFSAADLRCGATTSPHLFSVNERVCISGVPIADADLASCLSAVEVGRGDIALTYFEFLIVAALYWFDVEKVDVVVLEVGLGGRLDATNCVDSDVAVVTSIGVDHQAWLGSDTQRIAEEKAAICRQDCPLVLADRNIPITADQLAEATGAVVYREARDYLVDAKSDGLSVIFAGQTISLSRRGIPSVPASNAAAAIVVSQLLQSRLDLSAGCIKRGITNAELLGRGQQFDLLWLGREISITVDVAHNSDSAEVLADSLGEATNSSNCGRVALCAMLADKDCADVYSKLSGSILAWHLAGLHGPRGQTSQSLARAMGNPAARLHHDVESALPLVLNQMVEDNHHSLVIFGSFETVAAALTWCRSHEISHD
ncbi:MAG: dihydrofolate synthase/folylpolyglutamate synthase [Gammaproteobacteria bacterium]